MKVLKIIDAIITAPAWIAGYLIRSYRNAFVYGGQCYDKNVKKYWI